MALRTRSLTIVQASLGTFGVRVLIYLIGFVTSILIARALGPTGRGQYYFPVATATAILVLAHFSIEQANVYLYGTRRYPLKDLVANNSFLALLLGPLSLIAGFVFYLATRRNLFQDVSVLHIVLAFAAIPLSLHLFYIGSFLTLTNHLINLHLAHFASAAVQLLVIGTLFVAKRLDVTTVIALYSLSAFLTWAMALYALHREVGVSIAYEAPIVKSMVSFGAKIHLGMILLFLNLRVDVFLLKALSDFEQIGYYSLAVMLAETIWLLTDTIAAASLPYQMEDDLAQAGRVTIKACRVNLFLAALSALLLAGGVYPLIRFVYGDAFLPSIPPFLVILPGIAMLSLQRPCGAFLIKLGRPLQISAVYLIVLLQNILLNLVFIPRMGSTGAALATTLSYSSSALIFLLWTLRTLNGRMRDVFLLKSEDLSSFQKLFEKETYRSILHAFR